MSYCPFLTLMNFIDGIVQAMNEYLYNNCNKTETCWDVFICVPIITKKKNQKKFPLQTRFWRPFLKMAATKLVDLEIALWWSFNIHQKCRVIYQNSQKKITN